MAKQIIVGDEARQALLRGVNILSNVVKATLGPRGKNIILDKKFGSPTSTKDGVSVAKEIELKDPWENMGAQLVKEVASKTSDVAGDGTTTATVLAQVIYAEGIKHVTAGRNPNLIKKGIDRAVEEVVKELKSMSREVTGEMIAQVGAISANNDESIGKSSLKPWRKSARTASSPWKKPRAWRPPWNSSRVCSSTAAISLPISSLTRREWSACWRTR